MQTVELPGTGRMTSRMGYGCSSVMGSHGRVESLRMLEWAFDAGVRHFDVAPMYGYGEAEVCVGEFLSRHRGEVSVTTKYGIEPGRNPGLIQLARRFAKPLLLAVPGLKARAQRAANAVAGAPAVRHLSAAAAEQSLERSLRALRVERIDLFLLHDATPEETKDAEMLQFLERAAAAGKIGAFGVGTDRSHLRRIAVETPEFARVAQTEWSVFDAVPDGMGVGGPFRIHHRSLANNRIRLEAFLRSDAAAAARWSDEVGADLRDADVLSELMMRAALRGGGASVVLFSSKSKAHIDKNAGLTEASAMDAAADALYNVVQRESGTIPREEQTP